jgi:hypothetical protein
LITIRSKDKGLRLLKYTNDIRNFKSLKDSEIQDIKGFDDKDKYNIIMEYNTALASLTEAV